MEESKIVNVLHEYARITGVAVEGLSREEAVEAIKSALGEQWSEFDQKLIALAEIPDDSLPAEWLRGNRQPIKMEFGFEVTIRTDVTTVFLANLTRDRGGAVTQVTVRLSHGATPDQVAAELRDAGYSFNEVKDAFAKLGYVVMVLLEGNPQQVNQSVPVIRISRQPRSKRWWEVWKRENSDLTPGKPIRWILPPERITALGLPVMPVTLYGATEVEVEAWGDDSPTEELKPVDEPSGRVGGDWEWLERDDAASGKHTRIDQSWWEKYGDDDSGENQHS